MKMKGEGSGTAAQIRATIQTACSYREMVKVNCGLGTAGCGSQVVGPVNRAICEPQDRWCDTPWEWGVDFIIPYPILRPVEVFATPVKAPPPSQKKKKQLKKLVLCVFWSMSFLQSKETEKLCGIIN